MISVSMGEGEKGRLKYRRENQKHLKMKAEDKGWQQGKVFEAARRRNRRRW